MTPSADLPDPQKMYRHPANKLLVHDQLFFCRHQVRPDNSPDTDQNSNQKYHEIVLWLHPDPLNHNFRLCIPEHLDNHAVLPIPPGHS